MLPEMMLVFRSIPCFFVSCVTVFGSILAGSANGQDLKPEFAELKAAPQDKRAPILQRLQTSTSLNLLDVAKAMQSMDPVQKNLCLGLAQTILAREPNTSVPLLTTILENKNLDPAIRYWAFTKITGGNKERREKLLRQMQDDPALSLRFEAIKLGLDELKGLKEKESIDDAKLKAEYQKLLAAARLPEQVQEIAEELKKLKVDVDLLQHFGFLADWQVIGPFDNRGQKGFDVVYGPEKDFVGSGKFNAQSSYEGKSGDVRWQATSTKEKDGAVDLNPIFNKEKGAIVYAYAEFNAASPIACEVRLGCINANKVWVNGELALSNEVYHTGAQIDQYAKAVKLKAGKNGVLVKVCQNEQTEQWAQDWKFQLRFSDPSGLAIHSAK